MNRAALAVVLALTLAPAGAQAAGVQKVSGASTYTATSARAPTVIDQNPAPGAHLRTFFPQFSATILEHAGAALRRSSVRLFVDGADVTSSAALSENIITYLPRTRVSAGWHDVFLEGADSAGQKFSAAWVFETEAPDVDEGVPPTTGFGFFPAGNPDFGGFMHFVLIAPTDGFAELQLCGLPQLAFVHVRLSPVFFVTVPVSVIDGFSPFFGCSAGAFFTPFNGFGATFIPAPFGIAGPNVAPNVPAGPFVPARRILPVFRRAEAPPLMAAPQAVNPATRVIVPVYRAAPRQPVTAPRGPVAAPRMTQPVVRAAPPVPHPIPVHS